MYWYPCELHQDESSQDICCVATFSVNEDGNVSNAADYLDVDSINCFCHTLQLALNKGMKVSAIDRNIKKKLLRFIAFFNSLVSIELPSFYRMPTTTEDRPSFVLRLVSKCTARQNLWDTFLSRSIFEFKVVNLCHFQDETPNMV